MDRKIVFINQATGYLTIDIINEFAKEFTEVVLITGSIRVQETDLLKKVKIFRTVKYNRGNAFLKALSWIVGTVQINFLLKFRFGNYEKFYFTIPPIAYLFASINNTPYSITVYDLFPDALRIYNFRTSGLIYRWWCKRNERIFSRAYRIFALSERMKAQIRIYSNNCDIRVVPNWTAFSNHNPVPKQQNSLLRKEGSFDKFAVQYSGNIGATHNVEVVVELAAKMKGHQDVHFDIIGRGKRVSVIKDIIAYQKLLNCSILPFRRDDELYESLCSADLAIVTLDERIADASVPSKLFNLMAAGVPVMAVAASNSELSEIIIDNMMGKVFDKNDLHGMMNFIIELKQNKDYHDELSRNSLKASKKYTSNNAKEYLKQYITKA